MLDRLRKAVAPDYEVERELASGGMGTVFLGRDVSLERPVAIKVLRPDLATATFTERFLREARLLASLNHPNVVAVHRAGESEGLSWYVMDYLAAETLDDRLSRGPLPVAGAVSAALGVLAALDVAHRHGIVHRDVKPANVFLMEGRAVLSDFGIASSATSGGEPLTIPGQALGTPDYMAPEQMIGRPTSPATDLCSTGLLLYEALTGKRYDAWDNPDRADWTRVPRRLQPVLRRALALDPAGRWPDAASFAHAIRRARRPAQAQRVLLAAAALSLAAAGVALWVVLHPPRAPTAGALQVVVAPFRVSGEGAPPWLSDSLARALVHALGANADFQVRHASEVKDTAGSLGLDGRATLRGDSLDIAVTALGGAAGIPAFRVDTTWGRADWERAANALSYQVLLKLWGREGAGDIGDLPLGAAPRTSEGLRAFLDAERLFAHAQWRHAWNAYKGARDVDTTCLICDVRVVDVGRWLGEEAETLRTRRYRDRLARFPAHYQEVLRASFEPSRERIERLRAVTVRFRGWGFGWFVDGDEIFHRGPLIGLRRADALMPLRTASVLRPDFAPIWEHLAWVAIAEGDSADAAAALARYATLAPPGDIAAATIGALLQAAYTWRFRPEAEAIRLTERILGNRAIALAPDLPAAASELLTFEVPRATVFVGERFARGVPRRELVETGLLAQVYGLLALGRTDSALAVARLAGARTEQPHVALFAAELPAALALADSDGIDVRWDALAAPLRPIADGTARASAHERARAAWMLAQLAARARRRDDVDRYRRIVERAGDSAAPLADFLTAQLGPAGHGFAGTALRRSAALAALDSAGRGGDPFFRTLLHFSRAQWQLAAGTPMQAVEELRWHENNDFIGYPGGPPQSAEVDYAFATLARWDRARILAGLGADVTDETCAAFAAVARAWTGTEPRWAARADSARTRLTALRCGSTP